MSAFLDTWSSSGDECAGPQVKKPEDDLGGAGGSRVSAFVDTWSSSDDECVGPSQNKFVVQWGGQDGAHRVGKKARARRLRELELAARMYQPDEVRSDRCQALLWNGGKGKRQCGNKLVSGGDLYAKHKKENVAHGLVRSPIPSTEV